MSAPLTTQHTAEHTPESLNWVATGGAFGRVRRLPTFWIEQLPNGHFRALDEQDNRRFKAGSPTLEGLVKMLKPYSDQRTRMH